MLTELFSGNIFIIILLLAILFIILIGIFASLYYKVQEYNSSHFSIFVRILGALGIFLWSLESMIFAVYNQLTLDANLQQNYAATIETLFLKPLDLLANEKIRPEFAASFKYSNLELFHQTQNLNSPITLVTILHEDLVFHNLCQAFEDLLKVEKFHKTIDKVWIAILLEYSHSEFFQAKWKENQFKYNLTTQDLINLLITYVNEIERPIHEPNAYLQKAELLVKDPIFEKILIDVKE